MKKKFSFAVSTDYANVIVFFDSLTGGRIFSSFSCPQGLAISPNLLRYQGLEVFVYVYVLDASHLRQNCQLQDLGKIQTSV